MEDRTVIQPAASSAFSGSVRQGVRLNGIYEIGPLIAHGGMGEVYRGFNVTTNDPVAIKMILPEFSSNPDAVAMFRREASTLLNLHHEAIVRYFVFSVDPDLQRAYMAMEFVDGPSLSKRLANGPLPVEEVRTLQRRLAGALDASHRLGVIHRDISSDNVILPNADPRRAKIIDFGIARLQQGGEGTIIGGGFAGKYNYVSPEQLGLAGGEVTGKSDIYSLGLVLAEALRGRPIDMSGSQAAMIEKRRTVPDLTDIDPSMRPLIAAMLQPLPADRPESMAAVAAWTPPVSRGRRAATRGDEHGSSWFGRVAAIAATLIIVVSVGGTLYVFRDLLPWGQSSPPAATAEASAPEALPQSKPEPRPKKDAGAEPVPTPVPKLPDLSKLPSPETSGSQANNAMDNGPPLDAPPPAAASTAPSPPTSPAPSPATGSRPGPQTKDEWVKELLNASSKPSSVAANNPAVNEPPAAKIPAQPIHAAPKVESPAPEQRPVGAPPKSAAKTEAVAEPNPPAQSLASISRPTPPQLATEEPLVVALVDKTKQPSVDIPPPVASTPTLPIQPAEKVERPAPPISSGSPPTGGPIQEASAEQGPTPSHKLPPLPPPPTQETSAEPTPASSHKLPPLPEPPGGNASPPQSQASLQPQTSPAEPKAEGPEASQTPSPAGLVMHAPQDSLALRGAIVGQNYVADLPPFSANDPKRIVLRADPGAPEGLGLVDLGSGFGQVSGTPSRPGEYTFDIVASDANGASARMTTTISVSTPASPSKPPAQAKVASISAAEKTVGFLHDFDGGPCFLVLSRGFSGGSPVIFGVGADQAAFEKFYAGFKSEVGVEPTMTVQLISRAQCPTVDLIGASAASGAEAPKIELADHEVGRNRPVTGTVSNLAGRSLTLLLVSTDGQVRRIDARPRPGGSSAAFSAPVGADASVGDVMQMIVAIVSPQPLPSLRTFKSAAAADILPRVQGELTAAGGSLEAEFFQVR